MTLTEAANFRDGAMKGFDLIKDKIIKFDYINWKDEKSKRKAIPKRMFYGANVYHPEAQWLIEAEDLDKKAIRHFAFVDMSNIKIVEG